MLYEKATVIERYNNELIWVETQIKTSCNACSHNSECGTGMIAKSLTPKSNNVLVECAHEVVAGEQITVAVPEQSIVSGAFILYGLPLILFMAALVVSHFFIQFELMSLGVALLFGWLGFYLARPLTKRFNQNQNLPYVVHEPMGFVCVQAD